MPPSIPGARHHPGHPATVFESTAQKWSRLSPWAQQRRWSEPNMSWSQWEHSWSERYRPFTQRRWSDDTWSTDTNDHRHTAAASSWSDTSVTPTVRPRADAPRVRNLVRGTTADALAARKSLGIEQIIDDLDSDRYAASSASSNKSHVKTWSLFHFEVFRGVNPIPPVFPITVRSLIGVASLFKAGGYRSYPNYQSAARTSTSRPATTGPCCSITRHAGLPDPFFVA